MDTIGILRYYRCEFNNGNMHSGSYDFCKWIQFLKLILYPDSGSIEFSGIRIQSNTQTTEYPDRKIKRAVTECKNIAIGLHDTNSMTEMRSGQSPLPSSSTFAVTLGYLRGLEIPYLKLEDISML